MKIVLLEPLKVNNDILELFSKGIKDKQHEFVAYDNVTKDVEELKKRVMGADAVIIANNPLPAEVIEAADKLKFISVAFTGIDHVDKEACLKNGIKLSNCAGYSDQAVAELVIGMIISKLRNLVECDRAVRQGKTMGSEGLMGSELAGKTVGIVGTGRIGLKVAQLLKAFGCNLLGNSPVAKKEGEELGIKYVSLDELLKESDIVTLHTPLKDSTINLINKERLDMIKPSALLINCARGPVIDIEAMAEALKNKKLAGAAIDVFEIEPPLPLEHCLIDTDNSLLTPHVAYATDESMVRRAKIAFDNIYAWLDGGQINTMF